MLPKDLKDKPLTFEQAANVVSEEASKALTQRKEEASKREMPPPAIADFEFNRAQLLAMINHFIPEFGRWREVKTLLKMRANGASVKEIAFSFNVPEQSVLTLEALGKEMIMKGIDKEPAYRVLPKMNVKSRVIYPMG